MGEGLNLASKLSRPLTLIWGVVPGSPSSSVPVPPPLEEVTLLQSNHDVKVRIMYGKRLGCSQEMLVSFSYPSLEEFNRRIRICVQQRALSELEWESSQHREEL